MSLGCFQCRHSLILPLCSSPPSHSPTLQKCQWYWLCQQKLSKMAGNSASYQYTVDATNYLEQLEISGEMHASSSIHSRDILNRMFQIVFIIARIRPFSYIQSHIHDLAYISILKGIGIMMHEIYTFLKIVQFSSHFVSFFFFFAPLRNFFESCKNNLPIDRFISSLVHR